MSARRVVLIEDATTAEKILAALPLDKTFRDARLMLSAGAYVKLLLDPRFQSMFDPTSHQVILDSGRLGDFIGMEVVSDVNLPPTAMRLAGEIAILYIGDWDYAV